MKNCPVLQATLAEACANKTFRAIRNLSMAVIPFFLVKCQADIETEMSSSPQRIEEMNLLRDAVLKSPVVPTKPGGMFGKWLMLTLVRHGHVCPP
jgi:hypothetical protein